MGNSSTGHLSLRSLARLLGVDEKAVRKGIASGRLKAAVGRTAKGRPVIVNALLAAREWAAGTIRPRRPGLVGGSLVEAQKKLIEERIRAQQMRNDRLAGSLVLAGDVEASWAKQIVEARNAFLGLPSWLRQRCPELSSAVLRLLDDRVREILEGLATDGDAKDEPC